MNANINTDFLNAINAAADSWNAVVPSKFHLHYNGVSTKTEKENDGVSLIYFGPLTDGQFASSVTYQGTDQQIIEADIIINSTQNWSATTANETTANLQSVMLHEFGHWLHLRDLCGNLNSPYPNDIHSINKVMYYSRDPTLENWNLITLSDPDKAGLSWIYDHPAPVIDAIYPATGENSASISVNITGSNYMSMTDSDLTVTLSKSGQSSINANSVLLISSSRVSCTLPITGAEPGQWNITLQNHDGKTVTLTNGFTILNQPVVTGITPNSGENTGPVNITTLSGSNFSSGATVSLTKTGQTTINATNVSVISSSLITCTLPITGAEPGPWNVTVTNTDGQNGTLINGFTITAPPPEVTGIIPSSGENTGPVPITNLSGSNFLPNSIVVLTKTGLTPISATNVSVISSSLITCTLPITGAEPGAWNITVTNTDGQNGTLINGFTITAPPPEVTGIIPSSGENTGPVPITNLSGRYFTSGATVALTKPGQTTINAIDVSVVYPSLITCTLPITGAEPGYWNITVTNQDGQNGTLTDGFFINTPSLLTVTGITPASGLNTGTVSITSLSGTLFENGAAVRLTRPGQSDIIATSVQVLSSSQITCQLPLSGKSAGQWNVMVTNPDGGSGTLTNGFTITAPNPGNTPLTINPSLMNTFDGQYLSTQGYGWCDFGGKDNSYFKITKGGTVDNPKEFHLLKSFTTKAQFGILIQASNVTINGIDLSTSPNADQRPVNTITNTYAPLIKAETGAAGIKVTSGYSNVKLVNVNVQAENVPALHIVDSNVEIIGTNNPNPWLKTYTGCGINDNWGTQLTGKLKSGYGLGILQQAQSRSPVLTITGSNGKGVNVTGPFSGIEMSGSTASLTLNGNRIHIDGSGTESGTGSNRNSGITAWSGSHIVGSMTESSITGQEYGVYGQGGATCSLTCPGCTIDPVVITSMIRSSDSEQTRPIGSSITGGIHGIYLTGTTSTSGTGEVIIDNITVQGKTGYGIKLDQASGYNVTITSPAGILGGQGKIGTTESSSNLINSGGITITTGTQGPYPVMISLDGISGPDPFNLRIINESGDITYDITRWDTMPEGVTYNPDTRVLSFESPRLEMYTAEKYESGQTRISVTGIKPESGRAGTTVRIYNLSGIFDTGAANSRVTLSGSKENLYLTDLLVESENHITGDLTIPSQTRTGPWQVIVQQDDSTSTENVTFTVLPAEYFINATVTTGGTIDPSGTVRTLSGSNQTFVMTPDSQYQIYDIISDNFSLGPVQNYTFVNITANHTINAQFKPIGLTPVISGVSPESATQGSTITLHISGQNFFGGEQVDLTKNGSVYLTKVAIIRNDKLIVPNLDLKTVTTGVYNLSVTNLTTGLSGRKNDALTIIPSHQKFYTITTISDKYGRIIPSGPVKARAGTNKVFLFLVLPGAEIESITVDGTPVTLENGNTYTFYHIMSNHVLKLNTKYILEKVSAHFTTDKESGSVPFTIHFTDTSTGSPTKWLWFFGDGKISTLQNPIHTYVRPGKYTVRLIVQNQYSTDMIIKKNIIHSTGNRNPSTIQKTDEDLSFELYPILNRINFTNPWK
ncbi:PKD domain-containing protein [Methanospirillum stamsii]|uniref:PKD domain-containing protein n=1 Tax=Methanospirillum stamsii TaxID=1277351 RepID=UPI0011B23130|nr:PKD domain-containing protein [Methanospirillum stamsii]